MSIGIEEQLMGWHEACIICVKCHNVTPISKAQDNMSKEEQSLTVRCDCGEQLFTIGLTQDAHIQKEHQRDIDWTLDILDEVKNNITNVNTDKEISNMRKKITQYKQVLEDRRKDLSVIQSP